MRKSVRHAGKGCCDRWSARGQGIATAPDTFTVDAEFNLSGGQYGGAFGFAAHHRQSTAKLLVQNLPTANGTINAVTSHVFEVKGQSDEDGVCEPGEDCLVTLDRAALTPTTTPGLMDLNSTLAVTNGNGRFANACGKIDASKGGGQINFARLRRQCIGRLVVADCVSVRKLACDKSKPRADQTRF
ncbi:MAG: hypothetical protein U0X75_16720 [Acidobacteriota bacterium]